MIAHTYYDEDPRVRREAEALVAAGRPVHVIGLRRPGDEPAGVLEGVYVRRIDVQRHQGAGVGTYLREYLAFLASTYCGDSLQALYQMTCSFHGPGWPLGFSYQ